MPLSVTWRPQGGRRITAFITRTVTVCLKIDFSLRRSRSGARSRRLTVIMEIRILETSRGGSSRDSRIDGCVGDDGGGDDGGGGGGGVVVMLNTVVKSTLTTTT